MGFIANEAQKRMKSGAHFKKYDMSHSSL
jgi:hypothetical protein